MTKRNHTSVYGYADNMQGAYPKPQRRVHVLNSNHDGYGVSSFLLTPRQARLVAAEMIRAADALEAATPQNFQSRKIR